MAKVRTQIQLDERQYAALKRLAIAEGLSLSAVIRNMVDAAFGGSDPTSARAARLALVGVGRETKTNVARNHDRYLYDERL